MKILCVGRNYEDHARELKNPLPPEPIIFGKPDSALLTDNRPFPLPAFAREFHHEVELVVRIRRAGRLLSEADADGCYEELALGIDFTARDLQDELRSKGLPWEKCKGFDGSAAVSAFVPRRRYPDVQDLELRLDVNGRTRQRGTTADMIFPVSRILAHISEYFTLRPGDLVFTGTPAGVGPVSPGDRLQGYLNGVCLLDFHVE